MERKDIDIKDTWDLSTIYNDHKSFYHDLEKAKTLIDELVRDRKSTRLNSSHI